MKQTVLKSLVFVAFAGLSIQLAHACWICGGGDGGGYPSCAPVGLGAEVCVGSSDPPYCTTYFNDCCNDGSGGCGCIPCDGGCCASLKNNKSGSCSTFKRMALQEGTKTEASGPDHLKEFLEMADNGAFDGKTVYLDASGPIAKGILNLPLDHWKSFTQKTVLKGSQKDPRLDPKLQPEGTPQVLLEVETRAGHKFVIHLVDDSTIKKALSQQQSKSGGSGIDEKL
jgi:hypothetical protein